MRYLLKLLTAAFCHEQTQYQPFAVPAITGTPIVMSPPQSTQLTAAQQPQQHQMHKQMMYVRGSEIQERGCVHSVHKDFCAVADSRCFLILSLPRCGPLSHAGTHRYARAIGIREYPGPQECRITCRRKWHTCRSRMRDHQPRANGA